MKIHPYSKLSPAERRRKFTPKRFRKSRIGKIVAAAKAAQEATVQNDVEGLLKKRPTAKETLDAAKALHAAKTAMKGIFSPEPPFKIERRPGIAQYKTLDVNVLADKIGEYADYTGISAASVDPRDKKIAELESEVAFYRAILKKLVA